MKLWFSSNNLPELGMVKYCHMLAFFEPAILSHMSPYFQPLWKHLHLLREVIFTRLDRSSSWDGSKAVHSNVTCADIINIFKTILLDPSLISQAEQVSTTLGKHLLPGEYDTVQKGWDVVRPSKKLLVKSPMNKHTTRRKSKLMTKGQRK
jgi:hypothetical protein